MIKLLLHYPKWSNRWEPYVIEALREFDTVITHTEDSQELGDLSDKADVLLSMWSSPVVQFWTENFPTKKIITYLRRYELWEPKLTMSIEWHHVDKVIFVSEFCRRALFMMLKDQGMPSEFLPRNTSLIPNGIDLSEFQLRKDRPGTKKIGLVCSQKMVKNIPLAFQIMMELPKEYTLHHIGLFQSHMESGMIYSYMHGLPGMTERFQSYGKIPRKAVCGWLADKDFILSTSLNEGNPNNIIEAMAMGIKPVIHNWPGARDQFPNDLVFDRISGAVDIITGESYNPKFYRDWVASRYSLDNFKMLTNAIKEVYHGEQQQASA